MGKRLPIAGFECDGNFEVEVAPRSGAAEFAGCGGRLFDTAALEELPCVVRLYSRLAPLYRRVGFDDPHKIFIVPGIGISLGSRSNIARVGGEGKKLLGVGSNRAVFFFLE